MAVARYNPTMPWVPSRQSWSPLEGVESLRAEMGRLFDSFFGSMQPSGAAESVWSPKVDLLEHEQEFVLMADLPGMTQDDIHVTVEDNILTLQGKRTFEAGTQQGSNGNGSGNGLRYLERPMGTFYRQLTLGAAVEAEHITATYKAGVLEVHIPKTAAAQPKRIAIQSAS